MLRWCMETSVHTADRSMRAQIRLRTELESVKATS
jgi:hypothetical protein